MSTAEPEPTTTADEVIDRFAGGWYARDHLDEWIPKRQQVTEWVLNHRSVNAYRLSVEDIRSVCRDTSHALGDTDRKIAESVRGIKNWRPDFAFTHVFHILLEKYGQPFTYQDFREHCEKVNFGYHALWQPAQEMVNEAKRRGFTRNAAHQAMRWRVGNAYYSHLREIYALAALRDRGIDLRVHPLADALFRVDGWVGNCVLSLYIANREYREGAEGRKISVQEMFTGSPTDFTFVAIGMPARTEFGRVWLPSEEDLDDAADELRAHTAP